MICFAWWKRIIVPWNYFPYKYLYSSQIFILVTICPAFSTSLYSVQAFSQARLCCSPSFTIHCRNSLYFLSCYHLQLLLPLCATVLSAHLFLPCIYLLLRCPSPRPPSTPWLGLGLGLGLFTSRLYGSKKYLYFLNVFLFLSTYKFCKCF